MSHTSQKNQEIEKASYPTEKTYRRCGEDQLIERAVRSRQPVLKGVAHRSLIVILGVVAGLEGSRPRGASPLTTPCDKATPEPSSASWIFGEAALVVPSGASCS
jgi:hypothetical protein